MAEKPPLKKLTKKFATTSCILKVNFSFSLLPVKNKLPQSNVAQWPQKSLVVASRHFDFSESNLRLHSVRKLLSFLPDFSYLLGGVANYLNKALINITPPNKEYVFLTALILKTNEHQ